ncbi:hypothetical protein BDM02DRAFT_2240793 [Thelephora ganbajun]|uniref:Uncharacterized protein n=1 Tax=Thelephora ganbajun TaxID=370292 RepID=A0ACB6ZG31_THEGA|nr:hypothetical protein BDM02DRAFT_2240793 [Thelephora ganbajun]
MNGCWDGNEGGLKPVAATGLFDVYTLRYVCEPTAKTDRGRRGVEGGTRFLLYDQPERFRQSPRMTSSLPLGNREAISELPWQPTLPRSFRTSNSQEKNLHYPWGTSILCVQGIVLVQCYHPGRWLAERDEERDPGSGVVRCRKAGRLNSVTPVSKFSGQSPRIQDTEPHALSISISPSSSTMSSCDRCAWLSYRMLCTYMRPSLGYPVHTQLYKWKTRMQRENKLPQDA